jgi:hypothetical protein
MQHLSSGSGGQGSRNAVNADHHQNLGLVSGRYRYRETVARSVLVVSARCSASLDEGVGVGKRSINFRARSLPCRLRHSG